MSLWPPIWSILEKHLLTYLLTSGYLKTCYFIPVTFWVRESLRVSLFWKTKSEYNLNAKQKLPIKGWQLATTGKLEICRVRCTTSGTTANCEIQQKKKTATWFYTHRFKKTLAFMSKKSSFAQMCIVTISLCVCLTQSSACSSFNFHKNFIIKHLLHVSC